MAVLLLLVALIAPGLAQHYSSGVTPSSPCDDNSERYTTYYVTYASNYDNDVKRLDNVCHTVFPIADDQCSYLTYYSLVFCDGSAKVLSFIVNYNSSNTYIFSSPSCTFSNTLVGNVGDTIVSIRKIITGDCTGIIIYPVLGVNPCPNGGTASDLPQVCQLLTNNGISCSDLLVLPRRLPPRCVFRQNGTSIQTPTNCPGPCYGQDYDNSPYYSSYNNKPPGSSPCLYSPPTMS